MIPPNKRFAGPAAADSAGPMPAARAPLIDNAGGADGAGGSAAAPASGAEATGDPQQVRPRLIPGTDAQEGDVPAPAVDQAELDQVLNKAMLMIHGRKSRDSVLKQLHDPSLSVAEAVGRTGFNILMSVSDQKQAITKEPVNEDVLNEAASYVIPELMTIGCVAGIFPFDAPPDGTTDVGRGKTEFDRQCRFAMLEATKLYGEKVLNGPERDRRSQEAQDEWASGVQQEVHSGTADPRFMQAMQQVRGSGEAVGGGGTAAADPATADSQGAA